MTGFSDREKAKEGKYAHDQELEFKIVARRNKLVGMWAAGLMGKSDEEAEAYGKEVVIADLEEAGEEDVFRKLRGDLDAAGVDCSDHQIRKHMESLMETAREQVMNEV